jgi:pentose-5-phosphate-3-epimerase
MGLGFFIPEIYAYSDIKEDVYIVIEYCGKDFQSLLKKGASAVQLTKNLLSTMRTVFTTSVEIGDEGQKAVGDVLSMIQELVTNFVAPHFTVSPVMAKKPCGPQPLLR